MSIKKYLFVDNATYRLQAPLMLLLQLYLHPKNCLGHCRLLQVHQSLQGVQVAYFQKNKHISSEYVCINPLSAPPRLQLQIN